MNLWRKPDINLCHHFIWLLNLFHQVSHSNSKSTVNADRKDSSGNKGSRIVIEAIDKKLALLFVKQGGSSVSAASVKRCRLFLCRKGACRGSSSRGRLVVRERAVCRRVALFLRLSNSVFSRLYILRRRANWPPAAENLGRFYLSTVRCAVKRNTSSRRRRQLHPFYALHYNNFMFKTSCW